MDDFIEFMTSRMLLALIVGKLYMEEMQVDMILYLVLEENSPTTKETYYVLLWVIALYFLSAGLRRDKPLSDLRTFDYYILA